MTRRQSVGTDDFPSFFQDRHLRRLTSQPTLMQLPHDVLGDIFMLVDAEHDANEHIEQKFRLSQVCSYWRTTALSRPLLWAYTNVRTQRDEMRLPTTLQRSIPVAVAVTLWRWRYEKSEIPRRTAVEALVAHRARIKSLRIYPDCHFPAGSSLLDDGLVFPILEDLTVHVSFLLEETSTAIALSAPRLLNLYLIQAHIRDWKKLLSPTLVRVEIHTCAPNADVTLLPTIFEQCALLQHLSLRAPFKKNLEFPGLSPEPAQQLARHLRILDIDVDTAHVVAVLRSGFIDVMLQEIRAYSGDGTIDDDKRLLMAELFRGVGPLVELRLPDEMSLIVQGQSGCIRRIELLDNDAFWAWPELWLELTAKYDMHASLETMHVCAWQWNDIACAFDLQPQTAQCFELHVHLDRRVVAYSYQDEVVFDVEHGVVATVSALHRLTCPGLLKLVFHRVSVECDPDDETGWPAEVILYLLPYIDCVAEEVELCLCNAGPDTDPSRRWAIAMRDGLAEIPDSKWILCGHRANPLRSL